MEGFLTKIEERDTKFGKYYSLVVNGEKIDAGKFPPKGVAAGDYVSVDTETNDRGYKKVKSVTKLEKPAGVSAPPAPKPSSIAMDRQDVISRQAALNTAIQFLDILTKNDALPAGAKNLTPDKKADKVEAILMHYVQKFYKLSTLTAYEIPEEEAGEVAAKWDEQE